MRPSAMARGLVRAWAARLMADSLFRPPRVKAFGARAM